MIKAKNIFNKKTINPDDYVNRDTGELLGSEQGLLTSINVQSDLVVIDSTEYLILDSKAYKNVSKILSPIEMGRVLMFCNLLMGDMNIVSHSNGKPHSKESLMELLGISRNTFNSFLVKLYNESVIYYLDGKKNGVEIKRIIINPTLARKRKSFNKKILRIFDDLRI